MTPALYEKVQDLAARIAEGAKSAYGSTEGNCKEAAFAMVIVGAELYEPIAICQGTVEHGSMVSDHYWCRIAGFIVDPTAEQFGATGPLVEQEGLCKSYREANFFVVTPSSLKHLIGAMPRKDQPQ